MFHLNLIPKFSLEENLQKSKQNYLLIIQLKTYVIDEVIMVEEDNYNISQIEIE
jgi:hypothetical protein